MRAGLARHLLRWAYALDRTTCEEYAEFWLEARRLRLALEALTAKVAEAVNGAYQSFRDSVVKWMEAQGRDA